MKPTFETHCSHSPAQKPAEQGRPLAPRARTEPHCSQPNSGRVAGAAAMLPLPSAPQATGDTA